MFSSVEPPVSCQAASVISSLVFVSQGVEVWTWDGDSTAGPAHCKERAVFDVTVAERYRGATCSISRSQLQNWYWPGGRWCRELLNAETLCLLHFWGSMIMSHQHRHLSLKCGRICLHPKTQPRKVLSKNVWASLLLLR